MLNMSSSTAQMTITQALLFSFIFDKIYNIDGAFCVLFYFYKVPMIPEIINERMLAAWVAVVLVFYHSVL
jgi:hypothetical protein